MKKTIIFIVSLIFASFMNAAVSKTVNVTTAGTLRTLLTTTEMKSVTNLTVTGCFDARDFKFIRDGITNLAVLDISGVTIQAYTGTGGTLTSATSYPPCELPEQSFYRMIRLITLSLPNSVTSIGNDAFHGCSGFTSISIPNSVTSIGVVAFGGCSELTSTIIPNSVKSIGYGAFTACSRLRSITIGNSVTSIGHYAFIGCNLLTNITIPNSVTSIGNCAFYGCDQITSLTIGNSVTSIGDDAFKYCSKLKRATIPNSVTTIGNGSFNGCSGLARMDIPNSVTSIGDAAFGHCSGLTSIYSYAVTPVFLSSDVFASVNVYTCTLYVPAGSKSSYQAATTWGDFNIIEMAPSAIPKLPTESVNIYPNPVTDGFQINGLEGTGTFTLTDLSGKDLLTKQVKTNENVSVSFLPKGVYIVKIATDKGTIERKVLKR